MVVRGGRHSVYLLHHQQNQVTGVKLNIYRVAIILFRQLEYTELYNPLQGTEELWSIILSTDHYIWIVYALSMSRNLGTFIRDGNNRQHTSDCFPSSRDGYALIYFPFLFLSTRIIHKRNHRYQKSNLWPWHWDFAPLKFSYRIKHILIIIQPIVHIFHLYESILQQESHFYFYKISEISCI